MVLIIALVAWVTRTVTGSINELQRVIIDVEANGDLTHRAIVMQMMSWAKWGVPLTACLISFRDLSPV